MVPRLSSFAALTALAVAAWSPGARADDAALSACISANETSIQRRSEHRLLDARTQALKCATDACPALLRDACKHRVEQVNAVLPSIVFAVKDPSGSDVAVKVTMDGRPVEGQQGTAIAADPGEHTFVFAAAGQPPIEKNFILREGDKDRREPIVIGAVPAQGPTTEVTAPAVTTPLVPSTPGADAGTSRWSSQKTYALVAAGIGVAGVGVGAVFGLMAQSSWNHSKTECSSPADCPQRAQAVSDHDSASSSATAATIALIAGGAAIVAGAVLWLTAPRVDAAGVTTSTGSLGVAPCASPSNAGVVLRGTF
jgi:hypothetical protein